MKCALRCSVVSLGAVGIAAIVSFPAAAQFIAIPISNGSFALRGTGGGTEYVNPAAPMTLLSPAGTINITNVPLPSGAVAPTITTNTPVGMYFDNVGGSTSLNDGRTANFTAGYLKLQALGTVAGAASAPMLPTDPGVVVNYAVQFGSLAVPQTNFSPAPASAASIPISSGAFTINVPTNGQAGTVTINSILTPQGTANLTLTLPDLGTTPKGDLLLNGGSQPILMHAIANGSITLNNGTVTPINNGLVSLTGTATLTNGTGFWYGEQIPETPATVQVTITGGSISVPPSAAVLPPQPPQPILPVEPISPPPSLLPAQSGLPTQSTQVTQSTQLTQFTSLPPASTSNAPTSAGEVNTGVQSSSASPDAATSRPLPTVILPPQTIATFAFANTVSVTDQSHDLLLQLTPVSPSQTIDEAEGSPLDISRIHPGLHAKF